MQTGKSRLMPLVLVDKPGGTYWRTWDRHVREHLLRNELITEDDLNLYEITDDVDHAVRAIGIEAAEGIARLAMHEVFQSFAQPVGQKDIDGLHAVRIPPCRMSDGAAM